MYQTLVILLLLVFLPASHDLRVILEEEPVPVYRIGDDLSWAARDLNEKDWLRSRGNTGYRTFWSRTHFHVRAVSPARRQLGLQVEAFGAFEVYWDGVLIGSNGKLPQNGKPEQPGTESSVYQIPDSLFTPGLHTVAMRSSQSYLPAVQRSIGFKVDSYTKLLTRPLITMSYMNLMAGAFLIAAIYYFFLYLNSKRRPKDILIFGTTCLLFFALLVMEYLKFHVLIPYPEFFIRLEIIDWLTFANALLVPWYFMIQFKFKNGGWLMAILSLTLILLYGFNYRHYDLTARLYSLAMLIAAFIVVLNGIRQKEKGGFIVLAGLLVSALVNRYVVYDFGLFISFTVIVLCMLYLHFHPRKRDRGGASAGPAAFFKAPAGTN
ncbi:MAG: hypothetical protein EOO05_19980 [Chitinophagaceae bacterium]|nr:MAG: hypothetical protein EOO05_19980 [Chitinophagaceae bacterium]